MLIDNVLVNCPLKFQDVYQFLLLVGGALGLVHAVWRCRTADNNLRQERYRIGSELLDTKNHDYAARMAGATILAELARKFPKDYDVIVMKAFEAFLAYPPVSGAHHPRTNQIDYKSRDTDEIVKAINSRTRDQRSNYCISLPSFAPFIVTAKVMWRPTQNTWAIWIG